MVAADAALVTAVPLALLVPVVPVVVPKLCHLVASRPVLAANERRDCRQRDESGN